MSARRMTRCLHAAIAGCLTGAAMIGGAAAQPATAPGAIVPATPAAQDAPAPASGKIEEVVVTAQRRSQRLQKVPAAITALTGKQLAAAHVTSVAGLQNVVTGLEFGENAANGRPAGHAVRPQFHRRRHQRHHRQARRYLSG